MFWSESGEKSAQIKQRLQAKNSSKQICGWILMWETTGDALFHWRKSYYGLWTHILVKNVLMLDLFQLLSSPDVNWWTGVVWITCDVFISCLDSHSDGTHSLQSIHCWDSDAETHFYKPDEETNSSWSRMTWGWAQFQQTFITGWTVSLINNEIIKYGLQDHYKVCPYVHERE